MMVESKVVPIDSIRPNKWNPNIMRGSVYDFLKKSIKRRGFVQPIVVTKDGTIIDGEHRWRALKELGEPEVEVKVLNIAEADAKAETINFNLTKGVLDVDKLGRLLLELDSEWGKELLKENIVMEQKQINAAIGAHQKQMVGVPEPMCSITSTTTSITAGDKFALGNHTLRCGDSTVHSEVMELLDGNSVELVLTDPPYNVGYKYKEHDDNLSNKDYQEFIDAFVTIALEVAPFVIVTPGNRNERFYYYLHLPIIGSAFWYKGFALTPGTICRAMVTEPILFMGEKPKNKMLNTDHLEYHTDREVGLLDEHSCPKPIGLFKELIATFCDVGDVVLDLFGGSGTTLVACEMVDRICYIQEKDPAYCQTIIRRWEHISGREAKKVDST